MISEGKREIYLPQHLFHTAYIVHLSKKSKCGVIGWNYLVTGRVRSQGWVSGIGLTTAQKLQDYAFVLLHLVIYGIYNVQEYLEAGWG